MTAFRVSSAPEKLTTLSKIDKASRIAPSAFWAIMCRASSSALIPWFSAIYFKYSAASLTVILLKSNIWHLESIVGIILCFSVVASIKIACLGGSSNVLRKALKADWDNICTSSII